MHYSPLVERIAGEGAAAWDIYHEAQEAQARGEDVIVLSVGDPDLDTPAPVVDAAVDALRAGHTHYTASVGEWPLRRAIARHFVDHGGWQAGPENVCVVSGAQNGLFFASMLLLGRGDEVIVLEPNYVTYEATIAVSGAQRVPVATRAADGFRPDPAAIAAAVTPRTRAILFANPNNPTGVVMTGGRARGDRGDRARARPLGHQRRGLCGADLRAGAPLHRRAAGHGGAHRDGVQPVQVARHDRLAQRLAHRPRGADRPRGEPGAVRALRAPRLRPGRGPGGPGAGRRGRRHDAWRLPPPARPGDRAPGGRPRPRRAHARGRHVRHGRRARHRPVGRGFRLAPAARAGRVGARRLRVRARCRAGTCACPTPSTRRPWRRAAAASPPSPSRSRTTRSTPMAEQARPGPWIIGLLEAFGVERVFGIPGVHTIPLYDGLAGSRITHVTPRHEQGAGFMADAYARVSGRPGVCFVITGPGMTNIATAMGQAFAESVPMLVLSSVSERRSLGRGLGQLHELPDQQALVSGVAAFSHTLHALADLPDVLERAFAVFDGARPRPVHIEIPLDLWQETPPATRARQPSPPARTQPASAQLEAAVERLAGARRPLILAGGGAGGARASLRALAERLDAPVIMTVNGRGLLEPGHPLAVPASPSLPAVRELLAGSDAVLALGTEMGPTDYDMYEQGMPAFDGPLLRADIDPENMTRPRVAEVPLVGDAAATVDALLAGLGPDPAEHGGAARAEQARAAACAGLGQGMRQGIAFLDTLRDALPGAIVVGDSTHPIYAGNLYYAAPDHGSWFNSATGYGTLGYALPASLGASLAAPDRPVVCLVGDGGLHYTLGELAAIRDADRPIIVLVLEQRLLRRDPHRHGGRGRRARRRAALRARLRGPREGLRLRLRHGRRPRLAARRAQRGGHPPRADHRAHRRGADAGERGHVTARDLFAGKDAGRSRPARDAASACHRERRAGRCRHRAFAALRPEAGLRLPVRHLPVMYPQSAPLLADRERGSGVSGRAIARSLALSLAALPRSGWPGNGH
ncbi:MAG: 5-guanidino-2-oxopentanoate decarboxylase [Halofilum sp. (in: g-proteobacteria)]|nr:5-guanidino-2-oxopentanoate decarboxylase [Halofilum sp. (in: g-proteobacteria)]